jgi:hypothetical protein
MRAPHPCDIDGAIWNNTIANHYIPLESHLTVCFQGFINCLLFDSNHDGMVGHLGVSPFALVEK